MAGSHLANRGHPLLRTKVSLAPFTTLQIGGPADFYREAFELSDLEDSWTFATNRGLPIFFLGAGTNVLFSDQGYPGLVLRNSFHGKACQGREIWAAGGENLPALIEWANSHGLAGMERMYGIPGTLAGAIVGNAGAYGQEISQILRRVEVWSEGRTYHLDASELRLAYRHSRFKSERDKFIVSCVLQLSFGNSDLASESSRILVKREQKYPPGLRCPGSFFKNVLVKELPKPVRASVPPEFVVHGKVPAGKLLEAVGANGTVEGGAEIASYHGNLLINRQAASSCDVLRLAQGFADRVYHRFGIALEPEIRLASGAYFRRSGKRKADAGRDSTVPN